MRPVAGRLNGLWPEVGTILGPRETTREFLAVIAVDEQGCVLGYATTPELVVVARDGHDPRSVTETKLRIADYQRPDGV